jgi:hypothetical protein
MKGFPFRQFFDMHVWGGGKNESKKNNKEKDLRK